MVPTKRFTFVMKEICNAKKKEEILTWEFKDKINFAAGSLHVRMYVFPSNRKCRIHQ